MPTVHAVGHLPKLYLASSFGSDTSDGPTTESDAGDVVEVPIDVDTTGKEVANSDFDPKNLTREEVWLTILRIDDVESTLRVVSQNHEDTLMESLRTRKY